VSHIEFIKQLRRSPASHRGDSGAFPLQSLWDLWRTKWYWDKILFPSASYPFN